MGIEDSDDPLELEPDRARRSEAFFGGPPPIPSVGDAIPAPVSGGFGVPPPLPASASSASPASVNAAAQPIVRDRILVLGRRKAGKSVFLARLYERMWNSKGDIHMAAVNGRTHMALLRQINEMSQRRWPAATNDLQDFTIDVTYHNERFTMIAPDYPGEVFKQAFVDGISNEPTRQLLKSIDGAAAVIVLVDPQVVVDGDLLIHSEQDFGLVAAIKYIRDSPGAEFVPVAIALTKCDKYREEIEAAGGPGKYIRETYMNLCRVTFRKGHKGTVFACSAVAVKRDGLGNEVPDLSGPPRGLIEPLEYCLEALSRNRSVAADRNERDYLAAKTAALVQQEREDELKASKHSKLIVTASIVIAVTIVLVLLLAIASGSTQK